MTPNETNLMIAKWAGLPTYVDDPGLCEFLCIKYTGEEKSQFNFLLVDADAARLLNVLLTKDYDYTLDTNCFRKNFQIWRNNYQMAESMNQKSLAYAITEAVTILIDKEKANERKR